MRIPDAFEVVPTGPLRGAVVAPASKSVTNRLLVMAALADGTSVLRRPLISDDSAAMRDLIEGLGAAVRPVGDPDGDAHRWQIAGTGGRISPVPHALDCRLSGTTIRFGTAIGSLADGQVTLTGEAPLRRRPIGPLTEALRTLGATAVDADGFPPVTVGGGLDGGEVLIDVTGSSQYASAVLMAAPYAAADVQVSATGGHAAAYVELTVAAMDAWGAEVATVGPSAWRVTAGVGYRPCDLTVEYDASAAAHLFALAVASGGTVTVANVTDTIQPDADVVDVLAAFGATLAAEGDHVTVTGPDRPVPAGVVDLSRMPDQVTTVAALAALAEGPTTITGVAVARGHETDRIAALATELRKVGADVEERPDGLVVDGTGATGHAVLDTYHDHRLAMAFAAIGTRLPGVVVDQPGCVAKTFPDFWKALVRVGGEVRAGR
ncbi:3-phosphoshikimate 1-carboxyvinyltransferase [Euzebya sp.]|uniref:3-phosphoshikimate 1-carboxyvinyltransferase n=1 Tax=Euzebya sp. TaxID=1971409 RepID=UPI003512A59C